MTRFDRNAITIDLSTSNGDNIPLNKENLIHYKAYEKIQRSILSHLENSKKNQSNHSNLSIFIDGTRGAGKSTFLKNAVKALEQLDQYKLQKLIYIDPSKIELNEHIFLTLIAQLNRRIIQNYQNNKFYDSEYDANYELWRKKLQKLAGGLRLLNSAKNPFDLIDDDVFLDWGLDRADDAMQLAQVFKGLIEHACNILNCDAFLILIDDADTHFKKGEQVLEMIRRYLDIPQIIIIMAGDLQLYSTVVRGLYLGNMSENLYKYDSGRNKGRVDLLDHMEDQYLKKLFPIQNRILLQPLSKLVQYKNYYVKGNEEYLLLTSAVDKMIMIGLHTKSYSDIKAYRDFLLQQPLRSVLQLLQINNTLFDSKEISSENFSLTPVIAQNFRDVFFSSLISAKVEVDKLNYGDENALIESVFDSVIKEGGLDTGCYLRPQAIEENQRNSFVALASTVAEFTQGKASSAISYMLQCCGSVSLFYDIREDLEKKYHADEEEKIQQFKRYCGIGQHEDTLNWAWHATATIVSKKSTPPIKVGTIHLRSGSVQNKNLQISVDDFINKDKEASLPFTLGLIEVIENNKQLYFSIFNILGVISRLLKIGEEVLNSPDFEQDTTEKRESLEKNVSNCLYKFESILGVSSPNWSLSINQKSQELIEKEETQEADRKYMEKWVKAICDWLIVYRTDSKNIMPSSIFMGKVWIRLYFTLISVSNHKENWKNIGHLISLYVHSLINAFLVEEQDHHLNLNNTNADILISNKIARNNPKTSLKVVNDKLIILKKKNFDGFPFTKVIVDCPIIQGLIINHENHYTNDSNFVSELPNDISKLVIARVDIQDGNLNELLKFPKEIQKLLVENQNYKNQKQDLENQMLSMTRDLRNPQSNLDKEHISKVRNNLKKIKENIKDIEELIKNNEVQLLLINNKINSEGL